MSQLVKKRLTPNFADETRENLAVLRDTSLSQESCTAAHAALEDDPDIESLITNLFTHVEGRDMADYWRDFLSMTDALMQNVHAVHICNWDEYVSSLCAMPYSTKMTSKTCGYKVRHMSPTLTRNLEDPFSSSNAAFKTLLCSVSNKGQLQKLICSYLIALHRM